MFEMTSAIFPVDTDLESEEAPESFLAFFMKGKKMIPYKIMMDSVTVPIIVFARKRSASEIIISTNEGRISYASERKTSSVAFPIVTILFVRAPQK